jgi:dethiobiotin synthetase
MSVGYYVTGTDTGVGKTLVSVALLHAFRAVGRTAVGMKPVASGCEKTEQGWRNADALALQAASHPSAGYELVNPFALPEATAPQIAAAKAGVEVTLAPIAKAYETLKETAMTVVVEGVGGWMAPLADQLEQGQLAAALELPVILVVGLKLGCLSHARLTERAITDDGLRVAGWIGNALEPDMPFAAEYEGLLRRALHAPCLGFLPYGPDRAPASFAAHLRLHELG